MQNKLYLKSIRVIKDNQSEWGSYIASPAFPSYHFCWLRDGSFTAYAMDRAGEYESAEAFFRWVGRTIMRYSRKLGDLQQKIDHKEPIGKDDALHTRFSLDGFEVDVDKEWGNFQIDGYGTWLWALAEHVRYSGNSKLLTELYEPIEVTLKYLEMTWQLPNYDCWEEHFEYLHPYSLATVYAGFSSAASLIESGKLRPVSVNVEKRAKEVKEFILKNGVQDGKLAKHIRPLAGKDGFEVVPDCGVDASLIGAATPYKLFMVDDLIMRNTIQAIEADLHRSEGGVYRFKKDVYYGGGEWLLLAGWLGWHYAENGEMNKAKDLCRWIEANVDEDENLAEQVSDHLLAGDQYEPWIKRWGPIAKPLLWSHAMYIILVNAIEKGNA